MYSNVARQEHRQVSNAFVEANKGCTVQLVDSGGPWPSSSWYLSWLTSHGVQEAEFAIEKLPAGQATNRTDKC